MQTPEGAAKMTKWIRAALLLVFAQLVIVPLMVVAANAEGIGKSRIGVPEFLEAPAFKWSGAYLDLGVGGQAAIKNLDIEADNFSANLNGFGAWDFVGNARVGFNVQPSGSPFVFGLFAGYSFGSVEVDGNVAFGQVFSGGLQTELTPTWDVGALVGLVGPGKSLLYGGYRYQMAEFDLRGTGDAAAPVEVFCNMPNNAPVAIRCSDDIQGHGFIAGIKMPISPAFIIGLEYGYTRFDEVELSRVDGVSVRLEPELHTVMLRGSLLIGPNLFSGN